jgi:hypothetical protein
LSQTHFPLFLGRPRRGVDPASRNGIEHNSGFRNLIHRGSGFRTSRAAGGGRCRHDAPRRLPRRSQARLTHCRHLRRDGNLRAPSPPLRVNTAYRAPLEERGLVFAGVSPDGLSCPKRSNSRIIRRSRRPVSSGAQIPPLRAPSAARELHRRGESAKPAGVDAPRAWLARPDLCEAIPLAREVLRPNDAMG